MDIFGIGIRIGIGIETEWPTSKSIPIPMTPLLQQIVITVVGPVFFPN